LDEDRILQIESNSTYKNRRSANPIWKFLPNEFSLSARRMATYREGWQELARLLMGTHNVACRAVPRQWLSKHVPAATDTHAEVLLEMVFLTQFVQKGYKDN
jgi:hypothetical protein